LRVSKRAFDVAVAVTGSVIFAPVIAVAIAAIRLDSRGPAIFRQVRIGRGGKPFTIYKLRGMYIDARERFPELYDYAQHSDLDFFFHGRDDPRVTRVGRVLRRTSIDELPNLWNVLLGNMSIVGPRPEIPELADLLDPTVAVEYFSVLPGITCFSGLGGRDDMTKDARIALDAQYPARMSLREDVRIVMATAKAVLVQRGVRT
jgi:lipopolysaccharide/colanic/teichoic acid biosynthesis glycosyltransferase